MVFVCGCVWGVCVCLWVGVCGVCVCVCGWVYVGVGVCVWCVWVCVWCVYVGGCVGVVSKIQGKTHEQNDLKLGRVVVLDTASKPIDFGFKGSGFMVGVGFSV